MKNEDVKNKKSLTSYSDFKKHVKKSQKMISLQNIKMID